MRQTDGEPIETDRRVTTRSDALLNLVQLCTAVLTCYECNTQSGIHTYTLLSELNNLYRAASIARKRERACRGAKPSKSLVHVLVIFARSNANGTARRDPRVNREIQFPLATLQRYRPLPATARVIKTSRHERCFIGCLSVSRAGYRTNFSNYVKLHEHGIVPSRNRLKAQLWHVTPLTLASRQPRHGSRFIHRVIDLNNDDTAVYPPPFYHPLCPILYIPRFSYNYSRYNICTQRRTRRIVSIRFRICDLILTTRLSFSLSTVRRATHRRQRDAHKCDDQECLLY